MKIATIGVFAKYESKLTTMLWTTIENLIYDIFKKTILWTNSMVSDFVIEQKAVYFVYLTHK